MKEKEKLDGSHLVLSCNVNTKKGRVSTTALVDSGANGIAFVDRSFARNHKLPLKPLRKPRRLEVVDGRQSVAGSITHLTQLPIEIQGHKEVLPCFVTKLGQQPIVLGIPWLQRHDATISWKNNTLTLASEYCRQKCGIERPERIQGVVPNEKSKGALDVCMIGAAPFVYLADRARRSPDGYRLFAVSMRDIEKALLVFTP